MADELTIHLDNPWRIRDTITKEDPATGETVPASGLTLTGWLASDPGGAAIHAAVSVALVERGTTGIYSGTIDETAIAAHLTAGTPVWEVVRSSDGDYRTSKKRSVKASRPAVSAR